MEFSNTPEEGHSESRKEEFEQPPFYLERPYEIGPVEPHLPVPEVSSDNGIAIPEATEAKNLEHIKPRQKTLKTLFDTLILSTTHSQHGVRSGGLSFPEAERGTISIEVSLEPTSLEVEASIQRTEWPSGSSAGTHLLTNYKLWGKLEKMEMSKHISTFDPRTELYSADAFVGASPETVQRAVDTAFDNLLRQLDSYIMQRDHGQTQVSEADALKLLTELNEAQPFKHC